MTKALKVLSIQSHVVSGYVGNKAATFPLQTLGYDVDAVNSVQFSNHTGYGYVNGVKTTAENFKAIFEGLTTNGLLSYDRILTGYVPGAEALEEVSSFIGKVRKLCPDSIYLLDPVMGDIGRGLYVSEHVVPVYKKMLSMATIITPNHFELELLSGITIKSMKNLTDALSKIHTDFGVPYVIISSILLPTAIVEKLHLPSPPERYERLLSEPPPDRYRRSGSRSSTEETTMVCFASSRTANDSNITAFALPTIDDYYVGVGDLFSSLVLGNFDRRVADPLRTAVAKALFIIQSVLLKTHMGALEMQPIDATEEKTKTEEGKPSYQARKMHSRELQIIESRSFFANDSEHWQGRLLDQQTADLLKNELIT